MVESQIRSVVIIIINQQHVSGHCWLRASFQTEKDLKKCNFIIEIEILTKNSIVVRKDSDNLYKCELNLTSNEFSWTNGNLDYTKVVRYSQKTEVSVSSSWNLSYNNNQRRGNYYVNGLLFNWNSESFLESLSWLEGKVKKHPNLYNLFIFFCLKKCGLDSHLRRNLEGMHLHF